MGISKPVATPNMELVNRVFEEISKDLSRWSQTNWTTNYNKPADVTMCGTAFCFGGWALHLNHRLKINESGYISAITETGEESYFSNEASKLLGFNEALAFAVFYNMTSDFETFKMQVLENIENFGDYTEDQIAEWANQD